MASPDNPGYQHSHHAARHERITEGLSWVTARTMAADRRRHATRQLAWQVADHLRCCHGLRRYGQRTPGPIIGLAAVHAALHRAGS